MVGYTDKRPQMLFRLLLGGGAFSLQLQETPVERRLVDDIGLRTSSQWWGKGRQETGNTFAVCRNGGLLSPELWGVFLLNVSHRGEVL